MSRIILSLFLLIASIHGTAQSGDAALTVKISAENNGILLNATVTVLKPDSSIFRTGLTDSAGVVRFFNLTPNQYILQVSMLGYTTHTVAVNHLSAGEQRSVQINLHKHVGELENVVVVSKKPFVQFLADRTVVNVDAGITNAGATVLEVIEKSPGITVDRDGNISMKGRPAVMVMIDGKQVQLSGTDLQNLLNGMSAAQVDVIELIDNPGARFDAAGNAGIINIKTKKNRQKGVNGSITTSYGQGRYPKNNNSFIFNAREGLFNFYLTYGYNLSQSFVKVDALRTYYDNAGEAEILLDQPYYNISRSSMHNIRGGVDYFLSPKTTIGISFNGSRLRRKGDGISSALWKNTSGTEDSSSVTSLKTASGLTQAGGNINFRHVFNESGELSADFDLIGYELYNNQSFDNRDLFPATDYEATRGRIPSSINILSGKADYVKKWKKLSWESGWKSSRVNTDNLAQYHIKMGNDWLPDENKSNHFIYNERIHALYSSLTMKTTKLEWQAGLRYEYTGFNATQLGNSIISDSSFNRNYNNLFPTLFIALEADSVNRFTFRAGKRIDRPAFQKLNPFVIILNKYTLQEGNPFFRPQFTWNFEVGHVYKGILTTAFSYNRTHDYFSQLFYSDTTTGLITYTEGNAGKMENFGLSASVQLSPAKWWSVTATAVFNHKKINGLLWKAYSANINQLNLNMNNQFRFGKGWGAELSGFYLTRNQNDLQEVLDPSGQLSIGISKQVLANRGMIRLSARDIFYTQVMAGWTYFENVDEYFSLLRDTRVATVSFTYRFGKGARQARRPGAAVEEAERVGSGN